MKKLLPLTLISALLLIMGGCATGVRSIALPITPASATDTSKGSFSPVAVADARVFENNPPDPSTPSLNGDATKVQDSFKSILIGRQRGAYGMALGNVSLSGAQTVQDRTKLLIENGLSKRGYKVNDDASPNHVDVKIVKFWGWFTPGAFVITLEARIECVVEITKNGNKQQIVVTGYGKRDAAAAVSSVWQDTYLKAFDDFEKSLDAALAKAGM